MSDMIEAMYKKNLKKEILEETQAQCGLSMMHFVPRIITKESDVERVNKAYTIKLCALHQYVIFLINISSYR